MIKYAIKLDLDVDYDYDHSLSETEILEESDVAYDNIEDATRALNLLYTAGYDNACIAIYEDFKLTNVITGGCT